jgi:hypothetical protein
MRNTIDLTGKRFGRLNVIARANTDKWGCEKWFCRCDCGSEKAVRSNALSAGHTMSCGCLQKEINTSRLTKHGMHTSSVYYVWRGLKSRCLWKNGRSYKNYGGRGITVCDRWRDSFETFLADMPPYPGKGWSIERNNVNGNYEPGNCRWIPREQQSHNTRKTLWLNTGQKFNRWTVMEGPLWGVPSKQGVSYRCQCECGAERIVQAARLKNGLSKSCGCKVRFTKSHKRVLAILHEALGNAKLTYA